MSSGPTRRGLLALPAAGLAAGAAQDGRTRRISPDPRTARRAAARCQSGTWFPIARDNQPRRLGAAGGGSSAPPASISPGCSCPRWPRPAPAWKSRRCSTRRRRMRWRPGCGAARDGGYVVPERPLGGVRMGRDAGPRRVFRGADRSRAGGAGSAERTRLRQCGELAAAPRPAARHYAPCRAAPPADVGGWEWCSARSLLDCPPPADPGTVAEVHGLMKAAMPPPSPPLRPGGRLARPPPAAGAGHRVGRRQGP